jgi:hypothetical protein
MNVVITGASSGIGRALARTFSRKGHAVLAVARREDRLRSLSQEMAGLRAAPVTCLALDLTSPGAPQAVLEQAQRAFGNIHGLINDAGMSPWQEFRDLDPGHLHQILVLNIQSLTELCSLFLPQMQAHGEPAHLVNVSSVGGYAPLPRFAVYTGSKHYVRIFTNLLAHEYRHTNIRVSGLYPGGTLTEFPELAGQRVRPFARKTMLTPEQVAEAAYPAILAGRRVIIPGGIDRLAVLLGKMLPFPWAIGLMEFIYHHNLDAVPPTYPLEPCPGRHGLPTADRDRKANRP